MPSVQKPGRKGTGTPSDPAVKARQRLATMSNTCEKAIVASTKYGSRSRLLRKPMMHPHTVASGGADQEPKPRRQRPPGAEERRHVGAEPEKRGVAKRHLAGVAAGDVPSGRRRAPQQEEDQPVEEEGVTHHDRNERGEREEDHRRPCAPHVPIASAPR